MYKKLFAVMAVACMASACGILGGPTEPGGSLASQAMPPKDEDVTEATPIVLELRDADGNPVGVTIEVVLLRPARNSELVAHALCDAGVSSGTIPPCFEYQMLFSSAEGIAEKYGCEPNGGGRLECGVRGMFTARNRDRDVVFDVGGTRGGADQVRQPVKTWLRFLEFQPGDILDVEYRLTTSNQGGGTGSSGVTQGRLIGSARMDYGLRLK